MLSTGRQPGGGEGRGGEGRGGEGRGEEKERGLWYIIDTCSSEPL